MLEKVLGEPYLNDVDIVIKCKKYPEFHKQLKDLEKAYASDLNMSIYANLQSVEKLKSFEIANRDKLYVSFYGFRMKGNEEELRRIYLLWISKMDELFRENLKRKYTMIYYSGLTESNDPFIFLRNAYKKLPIQYYALLDKFYAVQTNFFAKNLDLFEFGRMNKLFNRRLFHIEKMDDYRNIDEIKKNQIDQMIPDILRMSKAIEGSKKKPVTQILQPSLIMQPELKSNALTIHLLEHKLDENNMPIYLMSLIETMRKYPDMMKMQGIFRKAGSVEEQDQIIKNLPELYKIQTIKMPETGTYSGYSISGVIKKFFTFMKTPIVPYKVYNRILNLGTIKEQEQVELVRNTIEEIPPLNRKIMLYVISFLRLQVLCHESTKMNSYAMSVIFAPCFFRPEAQSLQDLLNSGKFAGILKILFNNYEKIVGSEEKNKLENRASKDSKGSRGSKGGSLKVVNPNIN